MTFNTKITFFWDVTKCHHVVQEIPITLKEPAITNHSAEPEPIYQTRWCHFPEDSPVRTHILSICECSKIAVFGQPHHVYTTAINAMVNWRSLM